MSNKTTLQDNNLELSEILGDIEALPDAGGGAIETVPVTIVDGGSLVNSVLVEYTGLDSNGKPVQKDVEVVATAWYGSIEVVKNTTLVFYDNSGDYKVGYDSESGFASVYADGATLICNVGEVACEITPNQTAAESGGGIETWGLTIHANVSGTQVVIPYVDANGAIQLYSGYDAIYGDYNLQVPKGSAIFIDPNIGTVTFNYRENNFQKINSFSLEDYNNCFYRITGDVELTIGY